MLLGTFAAPAAAQDAAGFKIGVVDMDRVREEHTWRKEQYAKLESLVKQLEDEIKPMQDEIDRLTEEFKSKQESMSVLDRNKLENEIKEKTVAYQNAFKQRQLQIDEEEMNVNKQAFTDTQQVIEALAEEQKYHLVIPKSQVLYFSATIDITSQVVERLNKLKK